MGSRVELAGKRFGRLVVVERTNRRNSSGDVFWLATCDCGQQREYRGKNLRGGEALSCGCGRNQEGYRKLRARDLTGVRFGRLVAKSISGFTVGGARWLCVCDCGVRKTVRGNSLTTGHTTSCGCYRPVKHRNLAGRRFGKLVARQRVARKGGDALWQCACDCGRNVEVIARSLVHGKTTSCGCAWQFRAGGRSKTLEYRATKQQEREAKKRGNGGTFSHDEIERLYELQQGKCAVCRTSRTLAKMHRDHIIPLSAGGGSSIANIQLLCASCNCSKHAKHPIVFMQSRGFLL